MHHDVLCHCLFSVDSCANRLQVLHLSRSHAIMCAQLSSYMLCGLEWLLYHVYIWWSAGILKVWHAGLHSVLYFEVHNSCVWAFTTVCFLVFISRSHHRQLLLLDESSTDQLHIVHILGIENILSFLSSFFFLPKWDICKPLLLLWNTFYDRCLNVFIRWIKNHNLLIHWYWQ